MRFYEPIAIGLFVVSVLAASYLLGKRIGYEQGFEKANSNAFADGHVSGYNKAMDTLVRAGTLHALDNPAQTTNVATN